MIIASSSNKSYSLIPFLLILAHHDMTILITSANYSPQNPNSCGNIRIKPPFTLQNTKPNIITDILLFCNSDDELYLRASNGSVFIVKSIDYQTKQVVTRAYTYPPSQTFISHNNYSLQSLPSTLISSPLNHSLLIIPTNCLTTKTVAREINDCSGYLIWHYNRTTPRLPHDQEGEGKENGLAVFDRVSVQVGDVCAKCKDPNQICGATLRCFCHPKECGEKVINGGVRRLAVMSGLLFLICSTVRILILD